MPAIILPHSHRVLFGFLLKHSATYCVNETLDASPGADIPFLQSVGSKELFQEAFKRRLAKYFLHPSASVCLGDSQNRARGIEAWRSVTFESYAAAVSQIVAARSGKVDMRNADVMASVEQ